MKNPKLNKLKEKRIEQKLTTSVIASDLNISQSMYSYIEKGEKRLSYDIAVKLAKIFRTTPDDLFYEDFKQYFEDSLI